MTDTNKALPIKKEIPSIVWLRAFCVVSILLCHITQTHHSPYVVMTSQIFNIGVNIFIIISGFLFGIQGVNKPYWKWLLKRARRIFVPYWLFLVLYWTVCSVTNYRSTLIQWIMTIPGLQFFSFYPTGAEHTWFITAILLCYLVTPLFARLVEIIPEKKQMVLPIILSIIPALICGIPNAPIFAAVFHYCIAFMLGKYWHRIKLGKPTAFYALAVVVGAFLLRFVARMYLDGTILYSGIIAQYTHYLAGFGILILFFCVFDRRPWKIIRTVNDQSFEIYLYHYMFLWSPVSVMGITGNWYLDIGLFLAVTAVTAGILHTSSSWFQRRTVIRKK